VKTLYTSDWKPLMMTKITCRNICRGLLELKCAVCVFTILHLLVIIRSYKCFAVNGSDCLEGMSLPLCSCSLRYCPRCIEYLYVSSVLQFRFIVHISHVPCLKLLSKLWVLLLETCIFQCGCGIPLYISTKIRHKLTDIVVTTTNYFATIRFSVFIMSRR
jgi:hypothetical protein